MPNIVDEVKLDFKDVLLRPEWSTLKSPADVDLYRDINFRNSTRKYRGVPLIAANMDTVGTFDMAKALHRHGVLTTVHKYYSVDVWEEFAAVYPEVMENVALSCGTGEEDYKKFQQILATVPEINTLCLDLDVAKGYSQSFVDFVRKVREAYPGHTIIAGNVVTGKMVEELVLSGADIIKVGIGPGSVCTTPFKAGVGYPQLSAVMECADAAHDLGAHIISDGGCTCPGDVAKAFAGGADFVMLGGMLAGHDQSGGELKVKSDGTKVRLFYGVSSSTAMRKYAESMSCESCRRKLPQFQANFSVLAAEGKTVEVPYRGDVSDTIIDILGELRSACTSTGAANLKELTRRATFIRCTQQLNQVFAQLSTKD